MGRQFRSPRAGFGNKFVEPTVSGVSSTLITIPNYGVTNVSTFATGDYVLDAPSEGVRKTLVYASSSSVAVVVRFSTGVSVKAGHTAATQVTLGLTTADGFIDLLGLNSTRWIVLGMTVASTLSGGSLSTVPSVTVATS